MHHVVSRSFDDATLAVRAWWHQLRSVAQRHCSDPQVRRQWACIATASGVVLFAVRVLAAAWPTQFAIFFPDSFSFKNAARDSPFSLEFYADERPMAYPALLFLLGRSTVVTVVVQTVLYAAAFALIAWNAAQLLSNRGLRAVAVVLVVACGLQARFSLWNTHVLSESLGISLGVVTVSMWWRFSATKSSRTLHWAGLSTLGWLTVRDSNVPPWLAFGVPALLLAAWRWRSVDRNVRRAMWRWGLITMFVALFAAMGQSVNGRNRYATMNNVGLRVLPNKEMTDWFIDQGMPMSPALQERINKSSFDDNWKMLQSPDLVVFRKWADEVGQRQMLMSYGRFAEHWVSALRADLPMLLRADQHDYDAFGAMKRMPHEIPYQMGGPRTVRGLHVWFGLAAAGIAIAAWRRRAQAVVLTLLLASTLFDLYMAYVGDSVEVQRHMVGPLSRMAIVLLICVFVGADSALAQMRRRSADV